MADTIYIYSDGACSGNPGPGGWAAVIIYPEGRVRELGGGERPSTNNRMEMSGAIAALVAVADRPEPVKLYTDSGLLINGIKGWIHGWKRKGWLTAAGQPVVNRDLWESLDALASARKGRLSWGHVKGPAVGCGYSLLEPGAEHLHAPAAAKSASSSKPRVKKGPAVYLSYVNGTVQRHATWDQCKARVHGVPGVKFKKVTSPEEESEVLKSWGAA
jgi:ribonuclease HI